MEESKLRAHLLRIYCVTAAAVLFAVLFAMALLFSRDAAARSRENFSTLLFAVSDQLYLEDSVSHTRLRALERENGLMLSLRDNGHTLLYNSGDGAERQALFEKAEGLAREKGYDIAMLPLSSQRRTSPLLSFREAGTRYLGAVSILPMREGYRTLTMVQRASTLSAGKAALLFAGYGVSLALLSFVGVRLIDRALLPAVESRARQTRFVAAASHELRSPLAVIEANAAAVQEGPQAAADAAAAIERECGRMSRLIGDMLLLASADAGSWPVQLAETELDTVLLNVYEAQSPVFASHGCTLRLSLPESPLPRVAADGERLSEVLSILLDNALSYGVTENSRLVELEAAQSGRGVALTVKDHGPGMTEEQKERVFERFYRGDAARREKQHFGLGLSIAREMIRLQNGRLRVEDTPGGGCTFRITF